MCHQTGPMCQAIECLLQTSLRTRSGAPQTAEHGLVFAHLLQINLASFKDFPMIYTNLVKVYPNGLINGIHLYLIFNSTYFSSSTFCFTSHLEPQTSQEINFALSLSSNMYQWSLRTVPNSEMIHSLFLPWILIFVSSIKVWTHESPSIF